jgi:hypothetical protein
MMSNAKFSGVEIMAVAVASIVTWLLFFPWSVEPTQPKAI